MSHHNEGVGRCDWRTPPDILKRVRKVFGGPIELDPASAPDNPTGALTFFTENGLVREWTPRSSLFLNPPWGREADPLRWWVAKLWDRHNRAPASCNHSILVCPASVNAKWFHDYVVQGAAAICFPEGRVAYDPPPGHTSDDAPSFDTAIAYFGRHAIRFILAFGDLGWIPR